MGVKEDNIAEYSAELIIIEQSIQNIRQNGQSFKKGGAMGFGVIQAKLSDLYAQKREIKAKLALWGVYDV